MSREPSTRAAARSGFADLTIVVACAVIAPQIVLRAVAAPRQNAGTVAVAALAGLAALVLAFGGSTWIGRLAPRRRSHQLVRDNIGPGMGVVAAAGRFLCYVLLVVLGVGLVASGLTVFPFADGRARLVLVCLIPLLALPVVVGRGVDSRIYAPVAALGATALLAVLAVGLVRELAGGLPAVHPRVGGSAAAVRLGEGMQWRSVEASIGALFPAGLLVLLAERVLVPHGGRRHGPAWLARAFVPTVAAIVLTLYFSVSVGVPGWAPDVPSLSMASALFGETGQRIVAVVYVLLGCATALSAYARLPQLLRELAYDGILPRRLASRDALKPRLAIVGLTAVLAAVLSSMLLSTQAGATIFVVSAFVHFALTCLAMSMRSLGVLKESLDRDERKHARAARWVFLALAALSLAILAVTLVVEPWWVLIAVVGLAIPAVLMLFFRRGMGRVVRSLAVTDLSRGRRLPTRVHGVVLADVVDDPTLRTLSYARSLRLSSLTAVTVDYDPARTRRLREDWRAAALPVDLTVLGTPQAATRGHIVDFVHSLHEEHPEDVVTVFYPRLLVAGVWEGYFLRRSLPKVVADLRHERGVILAEVPYLYEAPEETHD